MKQSFNRLITWYKRPNKHPIADLLESLIIILPTVFLIKTLIFGLYQVPTCSMETTMLVGERFFADKLTPYFSMPKRGEIISFNTPEHAYSNNKFINFAQQYFDWRIVNWTKRVIGIPGDHVQGKIEDGKPAVYLNGEKLHEPYLNKYPIIFVPIAPHEFTHRTYDPSKALDDQPFYRFTPTEIARGKMYAGPEFMLEPGVPTINHRHKDIDVYDIHLQENEYWMMGDNRQGSKDSRFIGPINLQKNIWHGKILFRIWSIDSNHSWWILDLLAHPIDFWTRVRWSRCLQVLH
jgi:signal peptidase I